MVIKRHHIFSLFKHFDFGTKILFEHKLEEWRNSIGIPLTDNPVSNIMIKDNQLTHLLLNPQIHQGLQHQ